MALVEVDQLTKNFATFRAVDEISFNVDRGEVLGFLGPNGAGKSTTMKMIVGFLAADGGSVRVGGDGVADKPAAVKARIGYLPEGAPLYPDMTPMGLLNFVAEMRGLRGDAARTAVANAIEKVNLGEVVEQSIDTLSKGFKRRVGLAQAIVNDPEVLILDEPTDGLDPNQKHEVRELIRSMAADKAIILSTHILEEVDAVCSRCIIIADGKIVADGTPDQLVARSRFHNAVRVAVEGVGDADLRSLLGALPGVRTVEPTADDDPSGRAFFVFPKDGAALLPVVTGALRDKGMQATSLSVERGHLDEVFRQMTASGVASATRSP